MRGRIAKPWLRKSDGKWWVTIDGRQIRLGSTKREAHAEFARLQASRGLSPSVSGRITVAELVSAWLDDRKRRVKPVTFAKYKANAQDFADFVGGLEARNLKPWHVTQWLARHEWSDSTRRLAISVAKMITAWANDQELLSRDPLKRTKRPKMGRRVPISLEDATRLIEDANSPMIRVALTILLTTGMRPGELCSMRVERTALGDRQGLVTGKTGDRTVYLPERACEVLRALVGTRKDGPVFLGCRGEGLTINALQAWVRRHRRQLDLPDHVTPHCFRGLFSTEALRRGVDSGLVSRLLGHRDPSVLMASYANPDHEMLREAAERAAGSSG